VQGCRALPAVTLGLPVNDQGGFRIAVFLCNRRQMQKNFFPFYFSIFAFVWINFVPAGFSLQAL
jgi:hypothetical protein